MNQDAIEATQAAAVAGAASKVTYGGSAAAVGGWFLSTAIGNNLSGIFAAVVSGESGMTVESALKGYTFGFWSLLGAGVLLFLIAPLVQKLMHGVK